MSDAGVAPADAAIRCAKGGRRTLSFCSSLWKALQRAPLIRICPVRIQRCRRLEGNARRRMRNCRSFCPASAGVTIREVDGSESGMEYLHLLLGIVSVCGEKCCCCARERMLLCLNSPLFGAGRSFRGKVKMGFCSVARPARGVKWKSLGRLLPGGRQPRQAAHKEKVWRQLQRAILGIFV